MKLLSDATEYGLRAVAWLAERPGEPQKVREIARATHATPGYLIKVLQTLTRAGILSAQRGSHGGFRLERDPAAMSVLDIINAIDPLQRIHTCPLGLESHSDGLCPMHQRIDDALATIERSLGDVTIEDLLKEPSRPHPLCDGPTAPAPADAAARAAET